MPGERSRHDLQPFYAPRSVAVAGASARPTSSGGAVMQMMTTAGYRGRLIPVNPKGGELFGRPVAKDLTALEAPADLLVVAVRPDFIPGVMAEAARTGHKHVMILPGGFSESGAAGAAREREVRRISEDAGIAIAGPNCGGLINLSGETALAATFFRDLPPGGPIAFVSQSGALAEEMIAHARARSIPIGTVVSVGNALMLDTEDHLAHLGADPDTNCILLYLESARDLDSLAGTARRIAADKPIVALMPGRTDQGLAAAKAHTGAHAGSDEAIDRLCREAGILRAPSLRDLQLAAKVFGRFPKGAGPRTLILSNSGGPGVLATDQATLSGLDLVDLPEPLGARLREFLPAECAIRNPLDLLADAREDRFGPTLEAALEARDAFDMIVMIHVVPFMVDAAPVIDTLVERAQGAPLPILHSMMGTLEDGPGWFAGMEAAGVPMFDNVEDMARAAGHLAAYGNIRGRLQGETG